MNGKIKIKVKGHLDEEWKDWFDGLNIMYEGKDTILMGDSRDESYIFGILNKIRDLNLKLISVDASEEIQQQNNNTKNQKS